MKKSIWIVGAGNITVDYVSVLNELNHDYLIIGRGIATAKNCEEATGRKVISGGLTSFLESNPNLPTSAIVAVGIEELHATTLLLLNYGVKNILVEKPAGLSKSDLSSICYAAATLSSNVFVAYNRRFYASVSHAKKIINDDGGVQSFNFEFTEWSHQVEELPISVNIKKHWFLANSSHVIDLAFFLGGKPKEFCTYTAGSLTWHPSASIFCGAGISESGALFNYQANWQSSGRWSVEVLTKFHRLIFRPLEKLLIQKVGSLSADNVNIDYSDDIKFKPGFYHQVKNFLDNNHQNLCSINEQLSSVQVYNKMANYIE